MGKADITVGVLMLALCGFAFSQALQFPGSESVVGGLGPAFFPLFVITGMAILGLVVLIRGLVTMAKPKAADLSLGMLRTPALLLCIVAAYVMLMGLAGFSVSTPLFLIGVMLIWRVQWTKAALVGLGLTLILYIFFQKVLRIPLPSGILFGG
jgi:putative tricarboxylic transport membrane protein